MYVSLRIVLYDSNKVKIRMLVVIYVCPIPWYAIRLADASKPMLKLPSSEPISKY